MERKMKIPRSLRAGHPTPRARITGSRSRFDARRRDRAWGGARTDGGDGGDDLAKLELVEDGGLTSGVETNLRGGEKGAGFSDHA